MNCLTCRYEPDWSEPVGKEYVRRVGMCKWFGWMPTLPAPFKMTVESIVRYSDDSGLPINCKAWEEK